MNDPCPICGMVFQREAGYFLGAMYFSYGLGVMILVPFYFLLQWLFPELPGLLVALIAWLPYILLVPVVFRYSRVLWIYFDRLSSPHELPSRPGWRRQRQVNP